MIGWLVAVLVGCNVGWLQCWLVADMADECVGWLLVCVLRCGLAGWLLVGWPTRLFVHDLDLPACSLGSLA